GLQILDEVRLLELTAQVDDAALHADVDLLFRDVGIAEDLALNPVGERRVVGLRVGAGGLRLPARLTQALRGLLDRCLATLAPVVGIEEVGERGSNGSSKDESRHRSVSLIEDA